MAIRLDSGDSEELVNGPRRSPPYPPSLTGERGLNAGRITAYLGSKSSDISEPKGKLGQNSFLNEYKLLLTGPDRVGFSEMLTG